MRALDRRRHRFETARASKAPGIASLVARAIINQPFDHPGQAIDRTEAGFDRYRHEVANILAFDTLGRGDEAVRLAVAAVECEGDADLLAIVAAELEAVRTPAQVGLIDGDAAVVTLRLETAGMALQEQPWAFMTW